MLDHMRTIGLPVWVLAILLAIPSLAFAQDEGGEADWEMAEEATCNGRRPHSRRRRCRKKADQGEAGPAEKGNQGERAEEDPPMAGDSQAVASFAADKADEDEAGPA